MGNNDIIPGFDDETNDSITLRLQKIVGIEAGLIVHTSGYIDTYSSVFFQNQILRAIEAGFLKIIFEMSGVSYISSTGYGAFTHFLRLVRPQNGDIVLNLRITTLLDG
jgi:anti-anti-sigma factor